jgi:hypothetical protein
MDTDGRMQWRVTSVGFGVIAGCFTQLPAPHSLVPVLSVLIGAHLWRSSARPIRVRPFSPGENGERRVAETQREDMREMLRPILVS